MERKFGLLVIVAIVAGVLGAMVWYGIAKPGGDQQAFVVQGVTNLDSLTLRRNLTVGTYGVLGSYLRVGTFAQFSSTVPITVTNGGTILPTGTYQPLYAGAAVGASMAVTGIQAGFLCVLVNTSSNNITISDTVNAALPGDVTLGQYDALALIFDGTRWVALATSNN